MTPMPDLRRGPASAKTSWWLYVVAVAMCVCGAVLAAHDKPWLSYVCSILLVVIPIFYGFFVDGSWGHPIARRQYVQFGIIGLITAGVFPILYLVGYYAGRRWPARRK